MFLINIFLFLRITNIVVGEFYLLSDQTRDIEISTWGEVDLAFGVASKLGPLGAKYYLQENDGTDIFYFLHSGTSLENSQLFYLHYLELSAVQQQIIHHVLFYYQGNWKEYLFEFDNYDYEGQWFHQYMYFGSNQQIVIGMNWGDNIEKEYQIPYENLINFDFTNIVGGSFHDIHPITQQLIKLKQFPGSLEPSLRTELQDVYSFASTDQNDYTCSTTFLQQLGEIEMTEETNYQLFTVGKQNLFYYKVQFWAKVQEDYNQDFNQNIHIIRIAANRFTTDFLATGSNSFILDYLYDSQFKQWSIVIRYSSYQLPIIVKFVNDVDPYEQQDTIAIDIFSLISKWHFISITYDQPQLTFTFSNVIKNQQFSRMYDNVHQFSSIYYRLFLGGWIGSKSSMDRSVALVLFYDCANFDQLACHFSCSTCFGPLANQCSSCDSSQNRHFNEQQNTCHCNLWYTESSDYSCQFSTYAGSVIDLVKDEDFDDSECGFGYFTFENECFKCPSASQYNSITCIECLMRPKDWIQLTPVCTQIYYQDQNDLLSSYIKQLSEEWKSNLQFLLQNGELIVCAGCLLCLDNTDSHCFQSKYFHLGEPAYIQCQQGFIKFQGECIPITNTETNLHMCPSNCLSCDSQKCFNCKDSQKYFLNLKGNCQSCSILNCKYCFQYVKQNHKINSIYTSYQDYIYQPDDFEIGCALCVDNYYFSFKLNQCIRNIQISDCSYFENQDGQLICYSTYLKLQTSDYQQISNCQNYIPNCQHCIRDSFGILLCTLCEIGYYIDKENALCQLCNNISSESIKDCYSESVEITSFKLQLAGFLQVVSQSYYNFERFIKQQDIILINQCSENQILDKLQNTCQQSCIQCKTCSFVNKMLQCLKCDAPGEQADFYSQTDGKCHTCPYPCKFCLPMESDQIFTYNPYFVLRDSTSTQIYKCLKNYGDNLTYIDQKSGLIKPLDTQMTPQLFQITLPAQGIFGTNLFDDVSFLVSKSVANLVQQWDQISFDAPFSVMSQVYSLNSYIYQIQKDTYFRNRNKTIRYITNVTEVELYNVIFYQSSNIYSVNSTYGVKIKLKKAIITELDYSNILSFFNAKQIEIFMVQVFNTTFSSSNVITVESFYESTIINIGSLTFQNCTFINSTFLKFVQENQNQYFIQNITLINCTFISSTLISQQSDTLNTYYSISDFYLTNCSLIDSQLIIIAKSLTTIQISNFISQNNSFQNGTIIYAQSSLSMTSGMINSSLIINSTLYDFKFSDSSQTLAIYNFSGYALQTLQSNILSITPSQQSVISTGIIKDIYFNDISQQSLGESRKDDPLILLNSLNIKLQNATLRIMSIFAFLSINDCYDIELENILVQYPPKINRIFQLDNLDQYEHLFIIVYNFVHLSITNVNIINLISIKYPLIQIKSENLASKFITIQKFKLDSLLNINQIKSINSVITIQVDNQCQMQILNSQFLNNRFFYNNSNQDIVVSSLLKIKSSQSTVLLKNVTFFNNSNYNSSETLLYIEANAIEMANINANVTNFDYSPELKSLCGFSVLVGQFINITNSRFMDINSVQYGMFYVKLQFSGVFQMKNNTFNNTGIIRSVQLIENGGVVTLDGSQSSVTLLLSDIAIESIYAKNSGAFIYLLPSSINNVINIQNIFLKNVYSMDNSFANFEFSQSISSLNEVEISHIYVDNKGGNELDLIYTDNSARSLNSMGMKGYIFASYCNIEIIDFVYIGQVTQPILNLFSIKKITLLQIQLINLEMIFSFSFLISIQSQQYNVKELVVQNLQSVTPQNNLMVFDSKFVRIDNIRLQNISCPLCENGLINFVNSDSTNNIVKCHHIVIMNNNCGLNSCWISKSNISTLTTGHFINNQANQFSILQIVSGRIVLQNLIFKGNFAFGLGGAIYLNNCSVALANVILVNNTANIGGALYYNQNKFDKLLAQQLYLRENKGLKGYNSIREQPDYLQLQMYGIVLNNNRSIISTLTIDTPQYIVSFQQNKLNSTFIMTSSGQSVGDSEIFNSMQMEYMKTNISLQIQQFTQFGDLAMDTGSNHCKIQQIFINQDLNYSMLEILNNSTNNITTIQFNNSIQSYRLNDLIFFLDPYLNSSYYLLIDIVCDSILNTNYHFQFKVRTFQCGIGEYYSNSSCQRCNYQKGYFSVEKNSLECQRIDPKKIKSVTQSQLELYQGYWRYDYFSSQVEQCQTYSQFCIGGWEVNFNSCAQGYIGALCEECDIYNIRSEQSFVKQIEGYCELKIVSGQAIVSLLLLMFVLFTMTYLISITRREMHQIYQKLKSQSTYYKILYKYNIEFMTPLIRQTIYFMQILYSIFPKTHIFSSDYSQIIWPVGNPSKIILQFIDLFSERFTISVIYVKGIGSILIPALQIGVLFVVFATYQRTTQERKAFLMCIYNASLFLLLYSMPNIIEQMSYLSTKRYIAGIDWIGANVSYQFYTEEHQRWIQYFILPALIIFIIVIPLTLFHFLYQEYKKEVDQSLGLLGYFSSNYQKKFFFWELFNLEIIFIINFLHSYLSSFNIIFTDLFIIAVLFIYSTAISYYKPFFTRRLNNIEKIGIIFCSLIASLSCLLYQTSQDNLYWVEYLITVIMVMMLISILIFMLVNIILGFYNKYNEDLDVIRSKIKVLFPNLQQSCPRLAVMLKQRKEARIRIYKRFQCAKLQLKMLRLNNSRSMRAAMNLINNEGIIMSNFQRQDHLQLIISSPMQQSYMI